MNQDDSCKRIPSNASGATLDIALRNLIPPKDCLHVKRRMGTYPDAGYDAEHSASASSDDHQSDTHENHQFDWSVVIARARSHPHEAAESFYGTGGSGLQYPRAGLEAQATFRTTTVLTYKPLHAMLKYDPPLDAVEAVLRAHPEAALDVTFEGTALKIASVSRVSSMPVLRLLLVAELAMRKRLSQRHQHGGLEQKQPSASETPAGREKSGRSDDHTPLNSSSSTSDTRQPKQPEQPAQADPLMSPSNMFSGHNPILWITERRVPVKTAAMLLKWYPIGAFQRPYDEDGEPLADKMMSEEMVCTVMESPLIEIVDDFARDVDERVDDDDEIYSDSESDSEDEAPQEDSANQAGSAIATSATSSDATDPPRPYRQRRRLRKERRWEKFLYILYATDLALQSTRREASAIKEGDASPACTDSRESSKATASSASVDASSMTTESSLTGDNNARAAPSESNITAAMKTSEAEAPTTTSTKSNTTASANSFRPVHAWIRCITSPSLGLDTCQPFGAWSVLRAMSQRIPSEFTVRDMSDGDRTLFQTLVERPASDCRFCLHEVKEILELLIDADHRSAFRPRRGDGRLIGHVALENGWPCKDLFSRKKSATCA
jgi:hypothetical protein